MNKMIKNILFDFDGVILDSMSVRDFGFREIFKEHSDEYVEELIKFHRTNGGLSRFVKIEHFYKNILNKNISESQINGLANKFSDIMRKELIKKEYLIEDAVNFIKNNYKDYNMHIVSGSEHNELNYLCEELGIKKYFLSISGSPTPKKELVKQVLDKYDCVLEETVLIGDSINDYDAAKHNDILFFGYNNSELEEKSDKYIFSFGELF